MFEIRQPILNVIRAVIFRAGIAGALLIATIIGTDAGAANLPVSDEDQLQFGERIYIVQLDEPPALLYQGKPGGTAATRPRQGLRFNPESSNVREYARQLTDAHDRLLRSVGAYDAKLYSYRYTFNGLAARLTKIQAQKLRSRKNVLRVWEDQVRYLYTNDSPAFLGLFDHSGGLVTDLELKGENVVIGVIDSGITPEHASFDDRRKADRPRLCQSTWAESSLLGLWLCLKFESADDILTYDPPLSWNGRCEAGENFQIDHCNNKIIGARFYVDGFLESHTLDDNEFLSPRDADGHGTHIASTAAGNEVRASLAGTAIDRIIGIAPRARIAVYKACWLEPGQLRGTCSTADLQRAIEDAVSDGVDIINYSVGNTDISLSDPDDLALLAAANVGVLSVVAAGNDGPTPASILSPSGAPWVLTVAASSRTGEKSEEAMRVNAPSSVAGEYAAREASFTPALRDVGPKTAELVLVENNDIASGSTFDGCQALINGDEIRDKIAFLQRGGCDFQDKLKNVEAAGAIAAVVFNNQADLIIMSGIRDSVRIPAQMIGQADGQLLLDRLLDGQSVEVTLDKTLFLNLPESGNVMGSFSSRGPNLTAPDILKPDVTAPGVNILAAQTPDVANGIRGESFQYLSGTSMAVPHVAGIAALLKEAHPDWSPAAIKSALMTTARQNVVKEDGVTTSDPFDVGAGHIVPNPAVEPGLIYDAGKENFDAFTCGTAHPLVTDAECRRLSAAGFPSTAADLNMPTIAVSTLVSDQTIRRHVTNVGVATQYRARVEAPPGIDVEVTPSVLALGAGEVGTYDITLSNRDADSYEWQFGDITWADSQHRVRSAMAIRPVPFLAPVQVAGSGASGQLDFDVQFGYTGSYETTVEGLAAPNVTSMQTVADDPFNSYVFESDSDNLPPGVWRTSQPLIVDESDTFLRVALFNERTDGDDDLDLYVYYCPGLVFCTPAGLSGETDSDEQVDILLPPPGEYFIDVHGFATDQVTNGPGAIFDLLVWTVGPDDDIGNLNVVAPDGAVAGEIEKINVSWDGLGNEKHVGAITHSDGIEPLEITIIDIDNYIDN